MLTVWWVAPLIMGAAQIGSNLLNKPKQQQPVVGWVDRFINDKKGDLAKKTTFHTIMQSGLAAIGASAKKMHRRVDYSSARYGTTGSGLDAARRLKILKESNRAGADVTQRAGALQLREDEGIRNAIDNAEMMRERIVEETRARNKLAESNWKREMWGSAIKSGAGFATAGISNAMDWSKATELAASQGYTQDLKLLSDDPQTALKMAGMEMQKTQGQEYFGEMADILGVGEVEGFEYNQNLPLRQNMDMLQAKIGNMEEGLQKDQAQEYFGLLQDPELTFEKIEKLYDEDKLSLKGTQNLIKVVAERDEPKSTTLTFTDKEGNRVTQKVPQFGGYDKFVMPAPKEEKEPSFGELRTLKRDEIKGESARSQLEVELSQLRDVKFTKEVPNIKGDLFEIENIELKNDYKDLLSKIDKGEKFNDSENEEARETIKQIARHVEESQLDDDTVFLLGLLRDKNSSNEIIEATISNGRKLWENRRINEFDKYLLEAGKLISDEDSIKNILGNY